MNYLSNNSKKLLKELNNLKIDLDKTEIKKNNFFNNLNNKIISIYSNIIINENNLNIITKKSEIIEDSYFISDSLKNKMLNLKIEYVITYENNLIIFKTNKKFNNIKKKIIHSLKIIISLKSLFNRLKASQKITIYDINEKKKLPNKNNNPITPHNCNSGLCIVIPNEFKNGDIVLFRNEEYFKVLIHESIHSNFIDLNIIIQQKNINLNKDICTDYNILINESFTETFACLINLILVNYYQKQNINDLFFNETKFMINIFNKILNHFNINNIKDILTKYKCKKYFKQDTNVFSYYVLKTINYIFIKDYLKLINNSIDDNYKVIDMNFNKNYYDFIFKKFNKLNKFIKNNNQQNKFIKLSLYELKI